jgi:hypothetical protein
MNILCPTEDSANCVWLAFAQGNGRGMSFIDLGGNLIPLDDVIGTLMAVALIAVGAVIGTIIQRFRRVN